MLAQVAVKDADAHEALIDQTASNWIPDSLWAKIGLALAGQYQFQIKQPDDNLLARQVTHTSSEPT